MDLGESWAPFGWGLGASGSSFAHFWMSFDRFWGVLNRAFCKHKSKIGFKRPFGSISNRFWKGLGDLGWILAGFGERFGSNSGGGGRCLREAVSIRPPPGRRRVRPVWPCRPSRRRSLSGVRGDTAGVNQTLQDAPKTLQDASKMLPRRSQKAFKMAYCVLHRPF